MARPAKQGIGHTIEGWFGPYIRFAVIIMAIWGGAYTMGQKQESISAETREMKLAITGLADAVKSLAVEKASNKDVAQAKREIDHQFELQCARAPVQFKAWVCGYDPQPESPRVRPVQTRSQ